MLQILCATPTPVASRVITGSTLVSRRTVFATSLGLALSPLPVSAKFGDEARFAAPTQPESTLGSRAQETGSRQVWDLEAARLSGEALDRKKRNVLTEWSELEAKIDKQLSKGQFQEIQSTLGLKMATIKANMRDTARAANDGDNIAYREGSRDQPKFDYGIGTYELTAEAQLAEDVFAEINRLSVAAGSRNTEAATAAWAQSKVAFKAFTAGLGI